jgi:hypothetical protein
MSDTDLDRVVSILAARDDAARPELDRIGRAIGYGNACAILGELWDDMLEADGFPRGRGSMERRPERQAAERWKAQRDELVVAAQSARKVISHDRGVLVRSFTDYRTGKVQDPDAKPFLEEYDATIAALDAAITKATTA